MERITSRENPKIKEYVRLAGNKKDRDQLGLFVIEGKKVCLEAFCEQVNIKTAFLTRRFLKEHPETAAQAEAVAEETYLISEEIEAKLTGCKTPQGIFCVCKKLDKLLDVDTILNKRLLVMLCGVQDPGNLGTVLRTADAFGVDGVILADNCCDVYSPKVVRSTMGSLLRTPLLWTKDSAEFLRSLHGRVYSAAAVVDRDALPMEELRLPVDRPCILCIGSEGNGLSAGTAAACDQRVTIRMRGNAESLNAAVAAAVLMWELQKNR